MPFSKAKLARVLLSEHVDFVNVETPALDLCNGFQQAQHHHFLSCVFHSCSSSSSSIIGTFEMTGPGQEHCYYLPLSSSSRSCSAMWLLVNFRAPFKTLRTRTRSGAALLLQLMDARAPEVVGGCAYCTLRPIFRVSAPQGALPAASTGF